MINQKEAGSHGAGAAHRGRGAERGQAGPQTPGLCDPCQSGRFRKESIICCHLI